VKILIVGKNGQVGYELERSFQGLGDVISAVRPELLVNTTAYTTVDDAESEIDLAVRINAEAPAAMAEEVKKLGAVMIHFSTDHVFDGMKSAPYTETDIAHPLNVYSASKLAGEQAIVASGIPYLILRTSWVYGMRRKNFLRTVLQLARERKELQIVDDQFGAPTWCRTMAEATAHIVVQSLNSKTTGCW
jgi:dTDP-4-dehydrorhamnose reductase